MIPNPPFFPYPVRPNPFGDYDDGVEGD